MPMTFVKPEELDSYVGKSLEPSEWPTCSALYILPLSRSFSPFL